MLNQRWTFVCGHTFNFLGTYFRALGTLFTPESTESHKTSPEQCLQCREKSLEPRQSEHDEQALAIYEKQIEVTMGHIKEAQETKNEEVVKQLKMMLKNGTSLWAKKTTEIEKRNATTSPKWLCFERRLMKLADKLELIFTVEEMLYRQSTIEKVSVEVGELGCVRYGLLSGLRERCDTLVGIFELSLVEEYGALETALAAIWGEFLALIE